MIHKSLTCKLSSSSVLTAILLLNSCMPPNESNGGKQAPKDSISIIIFEDNSNRIEASNSDITLSETQKRKLHKLILKSVEEAFNETDKVYPLDTDKPIERGNYYLELLNEKKTKIADEFDVTLDYLEETFVEGQLNNW